ncbi:MAG: flagellar hook-length control protein FliK [Bdellovibrionales bacterium]|nr:flagellar hook-length control protein FliK [Bdellovibrionales bacterium]
MLTTGIPTTNLFEVSSAKAQGLDNSNKSEKNFSDVFNSQKEAPQTKNKVDKVSITSVNQEKAPSQDTPVQEVPINDEKPIQPIKLDTVSSSPVENSLAETKYHKIDELKAQNNPEQALTQRIAMKNFLFKMQKELNVSPEELIQAFGKLSTEELLSPPEESLEALLSKLDLDINEKDKARTFFHEMLKQTASTSMAEFVKDTNTDLSIQVLGKKEVRNRQMQDAVNKMNSQFFVSVNAKEDSNSQEIVAPSLTTNTSKPNTPVHQGQFDISGMEPVEAKTIEGIDSTVKTHSGEKTSFELKIPKTNNEANFSMESKNLETPKNELLNAQRKMPDIVELEDQSLKSSMDNSIVDLELQQQPVFQQNSLKTNSINVNGLAGGSNEVKVNESQMTEFDSQGEESLAEGGDSEVYYSQVKVGSENTTTQGKDFVVNPRPQASEAEESANVREVINQARLMVKRGGGEMKVQLSPHGLGEVTMKVNVEGGNVNVEMLADSHDAKKILEKGISELKATLAAHKLNVEHIKVDTSSNLLGDLTEKQQDAERQFAQQFLGEFRRNNDSWRNNFIGVSGARAYSSQTQDEAENPLLHVSSNRSSKAARRLDLVA